MTVTITNAAQVWVLVTVHDGEIEVQMAESRVAAQGMLIDVLCGNGVTCLHGTGTEELTDEGLGRVITDELNNQPDVSFIWHITELTEVRWK